MHNLLRSLSFLVFAAALASPAAAAVWSFASDAPTTLGGTIGGSFAGNDANADRFLDASEIASFEASYIGAPPATTSFSIAKSAFDSGDAFGFDLGTGALSFAVGDAQSRSIGGGSAAFGQVVGSDFVDAGSLLVVTPVPEPASIALLLLGLGAVAVGVRRVGPD